MKNQNRKLVVVLGMHRSGTSAIARGLRVLQVEMGDTLFPGEKGINDKGYWEDVDINAFNERLLERLGSSWFGLSRIDKERISDTELDDLRIEARALLEDKISEHAHFGFKEPRTTILLPFWQPIFAQLKLDDSYLITLRNPLDVAASLQKRDAIPPIESFLLWAKYIFAALRYTKDKPRVLVHYDTLLEAPEEQLNKIAKALGIHTEFDQTNELEIYTREFLVKGLRHNKSSQAALNREHGVPLFVRQAYDLLQRVTKGQIDIDSKSFVNEWALIEREYLKEEALFSYIDNLNNRNATSLSTLNQVEAKRKEQQMEISKVTGLLEHVTKERDQALIERGHVGAQKELAERERDSAQAQQKLLSERLDEAHREIDEAIAARDAVIAERDSLQDEQESLNERLFDADRKTCIATARLDATIYERDRAVKHYEEANRKQKRLQTKLKLLQKQISQQSNLLQQKEIELNRVLNSKSWRITKVLRVFRHTFLSKPYWFLRRTLSISIRTIWHGLPGDTANKHWLKGNLFRRLPTFLGWTKSYHDWVEFEHQKISQNRSMENEHEIEKTEVEVQQKSMLPGEEHPSKQYSARLIAMYLPQFHPIPENDMWWGKGFTEWTNTANAKPLFPDHEVPNIPADLGYYDLRVEESREAQAKMAREYGIEGFCYWHYWFGNGKRILERPFDEVLKSGKPDFPFCLAWANHTWSGIWHGTPDQILIEQTYPGIEDIKAHFYSLLDAFKDERYLKIDGRNVFCIYRPPDLEDARLFLETWRELAEKENAPGFYFIAITDYPWDRPNDGYDAFTTNPPVGMAPFEGMKSIQDAIQKKYILKDKKLPLVYSYEIFIANAFPEATRCEDFYPCVVPNWDNTPRSRSNGFVLHGSTPEKYSWHLKEAVGLVENREPDQRVIFIKSWNEWAETNYLEPDVKWGRAYLEKTLEVIKNKIASK